MSTLYLGCQSLLQGRGLSPDTGASEIHRPSKGMTARLDPAETVVRPEPGLARGRYEAPAWVFVAVAAAAIFGLALAGGRAVWLYRRRTRPAPSSRRRGRG
jgi:hypothetical protein